MIRGLLSNDSLNSTILDNKVPRKECYGHQVILQLALIMCSLANADGTTTLQRPGACSPCQALGCSFVPALSPYNRKKGISDRKPGSTLILRPVLCPSNYMCFYRKNEVEIMYLSTILKKITWKEPVKTQGSTHHKND